MTHCMATSCQGLSFEQCFYLQTDTQSVLMTVLANSILFMAVIAEDINCVKDTLDFKTIVAVPF